MTTWVNNTKPVMTVEFLVTEALDFLLTEDDRFLITNQSTEYSNDNKNASNSDGDAKIISKRTITLNTGNKR